MPVPKIKLEDFVRKLETVSEIDWARLAAFIDGEGTITIASSPRRGRAACDQHELKLTIANTSLLLFKWIIGTFGGRTRTCQYNTRLPINFWIVNELQSEEIIRRCLPYFIIKREQAEIALAFRELKSRKRNTFHNSKVTTEMWSRREELHTKIRELNGARLRFPHDQQTESKREGNNGAHLQ